ncbi:MAG: hypothetical protein Q8Q33_06750 [Chlamydiota bacterium]|nr:hypothetical protein [Chlamydiota bacterium]
MHYIKPVICFVNPHVVAINQQYVATITSITINPEGCYELTQDGEVPPGNYSFNAQGTADAGQCHVAFSIVGSAVVTETTILACEITGLDCTINANCSVSPGVAGDVCVTSATLNGVPQEGLPLCDTISSALMDQLIDEALTTCVSS